MVRAHALLESENLQAAECAENTWCLRDEAREKRGKSGRNDVDPLCMIFQVY